MGLTVLEKLQDITYLQNIKVGRYELPEKTRGLYYEESNYRAITINSSVTTINEDGLCNGGGNRSQCSRRWQSIFSW